GFVGEVALAELGAGIRIERVNIAGCRDVFGHDAAAFGEAATDAAFDLTRNLRLESENVVELPIEILAPDLLAILASKQLGAHADAISGGSYAGLKKIVSGPSRDIFALVRELL